MEIAIGICSDNCKSNQYSVARINDAIYYHLAGRGMIECGNERKPVGVVVKQDDKIRVEIDLRRKKSISWYVNDKIVGTQ